MEHPRQPEDLNRKVELSSDGNVSPVFLPEAAIGKEDPLSREKLVDLLKAGNPLSSEAVIQVRLWLDREKIKMGTKAESMNEQVILMIREAKIYEDAGHRKQALGILEEALMSAEYDENVSLETLNDLRRMIEKGTTNI